MYLAVINHVAYNRVFSRALKTDSRAESGEFQILYYHIVMP